MTIIDRRAFIQDNTALLRPPHCPEITLHLADEAVALWQLTEEELQTQGLPPPFWAFAWAGGQALARYILDQPEHVVGKRVIDLASGSGLVAIAAAKAGADHVTAIEIDAFAQEAIMLNAQANNVVLDTMLADVIGQDIACDTLLIGDLFYQREIAEPLYAWVQKLQAQGINVLIGDPGRTYLPKQGLVELATYEVAVSRDLEDADIKRTRVWTLAARDASHINN